MQALFGCGMPFPALTTAQIRAGRSAKAAVDPWQPYACFVEPECSAAGLVEDVATIFLTSRECPWTCVFCDLWKHTLDAPTPPGATAAQIRFALEQLKETQGWPSLGFGATQIKLYNSGNFFDLLAIPPGDHAEIAELVRGFRTVIVENHPRLTDERVLAFRDKLAGRLEVALGLETVHPEVLPRLNKQLTVAEYERASRFLRAHKCDVRTFLLLRPPGLTDKEGVDWAVRSMETAFAAGSQCCSVIPTRAGNGAMDGLARQSWFAPPSIDAMYEVLRRGLALRGGRVFVDLWNVEQFYGCTECGPKQAAVLREMNLTQQTRDWPVCSCQS
jgi:radical SAM enzyme (TIGR01210 family)